MKRIMIIAIVLTVFTGHVQAQEEWQRTPMLFGHIPMHKQFTVNYDDTWSFSAHDKQAHAGVGAAVELFLFTKMQPKFGKWAHVPANIINANLGLVWEIKDGWVRGKLGDDKGFSKHDWGYVVMGGLTATAFDLAIPSMKKVGRKIPVIKRVVPKKKGERYEGVKAEIRSI